MGIFRRGKKKADKQESPIVRDIRLRSERKATKESQTRKQTRNTRKAKRITRHATEFTARKHTTPKSRRRDIVPRGDRRKSYLGWEYV